MKPTIRYLVQVFLLVALAQALFIGAIIHHTASALSIDTYASFDSIYNRSARMAVYGTPLVVQQTAEPQLIIFGSSDGLVGLRPAQLSPLVHMNVHNLSVPGHTITAYAKLLDLLYQQTPPEQWHNINVVVAVSATSFKSDALQWPDGLTDIEHELLHYGAFYRTESGIAPRLGARNISLMLQVTQPFMVPVSVFHAGLRELLNNPYGYGIIKRFVPYAWWGGIKKRWFPSDAESNSRPPLSAERRVLAVEHLNNYMGPPEAWNNKGFEQLEQIAARVSAAGGHFFFVDLPTAQWLEDGLRFQPYYEKHKLPYIARLGTIPSAHYINLRQGFRDDDFYDGAHTRAAVRPEIARRVAGPINRALAQSPNKEHLR